MDVEFHQLDLRYEPLRILNPRRERRLLASIGEVGQLAPISVVAIEDSGDDTPQQYAVLDGFARVRVLRRLGRDTLCAMVWDNVSELDALLMTRSLRSSEKESAVEQAWLLAELVDRFNLSQEELARRFDRSQCWVSCRLALVRELPDSVQAELRKGRIAPHTAAKYLVPMARANRQDCERIARAISEEGLSTRDVGLLYAGWRDGSAITRQRLIENPALFLRVRRSADEAAPAPEEPDLRDALLKEASVIGAAVRRARERLRLSMDDERNPWDLKDAAGSFRIVQSDIWKLIETIETIEKTEEEEDAGSRHTNDDPRAA